jgi:transposase
MDTVAVLGIDIAKNVFQLHGVNSKGRCVLKKRVSRDKLLSFMGSLPSCLVGLEACGSSHHWARHLKVLGHEVKLMSPQYVKPYIKTNKNDRNDAEGICEAVSRPSMHFVSIKSIEQQDIQALHRIRQRLMQARTALVNQVRGLLAEYGIVMSQGVSVVRKKLPEVLSDESNDLTALAKAIFSPLYEELESLDKRIKEMDMCVEKIAKASEVCQRLTKVEGVGPLTATALVAGVGDVHVFKNGRQMAAWLGLVPRQRSSGNKQVLLGISKRGDSYLRTLLIHGARSVVSRVREGSSWLRGLIQRTGSNKACVALANKNARVLWALMAQGTDYQPRTL